VFVAYWSAALDRKLPAGMTVNAVSPGNTPGTGAPRNVGFLMRRVLLPIMKIVPGMSGTVSVAAGRYIEAAGYSDEVSGHFFASPPKKMIGQMEKVVRPHLLDRESQDATWDAIVRVAGGVDYPVAVGQESR